jgi:hypothetical protein
LTSTRQSTVSKSCQVPSQNEKERKREEKKRGEKKEGEN